MYFNVIPLAPHRTTWLSPQPNQESIIGGCQEMNRMFEEASVRCQDGSAVKHEDKPGMATESEPALHPEVTAPASERRLTNCGVQC